MISYIWAIVRAPWHHAGHQPQLVVFPGYGGGWSGIAMRFDVEGVDADVELRCSRLMEFDGHVPDCYAHVRAGRSTIGHFWRILAGGVHLDLDGQLIAID